MSSCERHTKTEGTGDWEEVIAPIDCSYYCIVVASPGQTFDKCCDPGDATTCSSGLTQHTVLAPPTALPGQRWQSGEVITYVRSSEALNLYFLK